MQDHQGRQTIPMTFTSTNGSTPILAPPGYKPRTDDGPMVYDDEVDGLEPSMPWRSFFDGGNNRLHFVSTDQDAQPHFVDQVSMSGEYQAYGPGYSQSFNDARDAFYFAELHMNLHGEVEG